MGTHARTILPNLWPSRVSSRSRLVVARILAVACVPVLLDIPGQNVSHPLLLLLFNTLASSTSILPPSQASLQRPFLEKRRPRSARRLPRLDVLSRRPRHPRYSLELSSDCRPVRLDHHLRQRSSFRRHQGPKLSAEGPGVLRGTGRTRIHRAHLSRAIHVGAEVGPGVFRRRICWLDDKTWLLC